MKPSDTVAAHATGAAEKLTVRSALNPVLWLCGIVSIPALTIAALLNAPSLWLTIILLLLVCGPVAAALFGFFFLLFNDRDKLQSEEYQLRKQTLMVMQQKGQDSPMPIPSPEYFIPPPPSLTGSLGEDNVR